MPTLKHRPEGKFSLRERRKVYFTCHPADFDRYFEKIAADILRTHECVIYYTEDLSAPFAEEEIETDLGSYNLYVLPVTHRLLSEPCRAMTQDLPYAKEKNIPILPFMMEGGLDSLFSLEKNFGKRQYLSPYESDPSAIGYAEKLKKYLDGVLLDDETAARIRAAFDAYIFLSYRKKDRAYANELMRLIHEKPAFRDIAVWYDEFLTPGESFEENITRVLQDSRLFALLVTPQLLEEPNFVMDTEYPAAHTAGLPILPAEMQETDRATLSEKYAGIPPCVDPHDREAFYASLAAALADLAKKENSADPTHSYLMGLAYLDGIDVEFDRARGISLLTAAAEAGLPEAMERLHDLYDAKGEYQKTLPLAERLAAHYAKASGKEHPDTLEWRHRLALHYGRLGHHKKALDLHEKNHAAFCRVLDEEHPSVMASLAALAGEYSHLGKQQKALKLFEKSYRSLCRVLGEEHPNTLKILTSVANHLPDIEEACKLQKKICDIERRILGEEHPNTLSSRSNLACMYEEMKRHREAIDLEEEIYDARCRILGREHPHTLISLNILARSYQSLGKHQEAADRCREVYDARCRILGEEHPDTLNSLLGLTDLYLSLEKNQEAWKLGEKAYAIHCRALGKEHSSTLNALETLARAHTKCGEREKAAELYEQGYHARCRTLGKEHPDTVGSLMLLTAAYSALGRPEKAMLYQEKFYDALCVLRGDAHRETLAALDILAHRCSRAGEHKRAVELYEKLYFTRVRTLGEEHPDTLDALGNLAIAYGDMGEEQKAADLLQIKASRIMRPKP